MAETLHPAASSAPPWFITAPGETDVLMIVMAVFLAVFVVTLGVLYFRLHHLPEHLASKGQKVQYELVAVLSLIAMFTHENLFWIAALLLAIIDFPDFGALFRRIATSMTRIADRSSRQRLAETSAAPILSVKGRAERGIPDPQAGRHSSQ